MRQDDGSFHWYQVKEFVTLPAVNLLSVLFMKRARFQFGFIALFAGLASPAALAQPSPSISFVPVSVPVPILTNTALIALALLLAVIALRFFRADRGTLKAVGIGILGASMLIGDFAIERTIAGFTFYTIMDGACSAGASVELTDDDLLVENSCLNQMRVSGYENCPAPSFISEPPCEVGAVLDAAGGQCYTPSSCFPPSDVRLKTDILLIGMTDIGLPWYQFRYRNDAKVYEGVMAQDVLMHTPAAVHQMPNGYLAVDYGMLGLTMKVVN